MPPSAAILAIGRGMRRSSSRKRARPPKRYTVTTFIARSGQAPSSCRVWARARKKTPKPTPEASAIARPEGSRDPHQHRDRDRGHRGRGRDDRHRPDRQRAVEKEDARAGGQPGDGAPQEIVRRRQPRTGKRHERAEEDEPAELGYGDHGDGGGAAGRPSADEIGGAVGQGAPDREQISDHENCLRPGGGPVERLRQGMASAAAARKPVAGTLEATP